MKRARRSLVEQMDLVQDSSSKHDACLSNFGKRHQRCEVIDVFLSDVPWGPYRKHKEA